MKIIVGLGNPGTRYTHTRHNIGARIVESFGAECGITLSDHRFQGRFGSGPFIQAGAEPQEIALLLPEAFMNRSGEAVAEALAELPAGDVAPDLLVVFDDLDLVGNAQSPADDPLHGSSGQAAPPDPCPGARGNGKPRNASMMSTTSLMLTLKSTTQGSTSARIFVGLPGRFANPSRAASTPR